ncbi:MAG TPA: cell wall-binding repeat-containing protein, partial [Acidothermaceae bacterium]
TVGTVYLARGDNFADALVAGPVAGAAAHPILLTANPTTLGAGAPGFLGGTAAGAVTTVTALGLTSAVSAATLNAAAGSVS